MMATAGRVSLMESLTDFVQRLKADKLEMIGDYLDIRSVHRKLENA